MKRTVFVILLMVVARAAAISAGPILVNVRDTTILRGSVLSIPVRIDSSVTALNVISYELDITYTSTTLVVDSVSSVGTMSASWGTPTFHLSPGHVTISGASPNPLSGTGVLVNLKVHFPSSFTNTYSPIQFNKALLNEGVPATVVHNGNIYVTNLPVITTYPETGLLAVGETLQFGVSGGTVPYTYSTTNSAVATINSSGLLTGISAGFCRVVGIDNTGLRDTTSLVEIRAVKLTARDTTFLQGQTFLLPIYISDLSQVKIRSGSFTLTYNQNILTALGISRPGTLLSAIGGPTTHISPGSISVGFADTAALSGAGTQVLIYLQMKVTLINGYGSALQFSNILFNENITATNRDGSFTPILLGTFTVSPNTGTLIAGDSLQFTTSGSVTNPVTWSVSDPTRASISATGKLKALKAGVVTVKAVDAISSSGTTGNISIYDMTFQLPSVNSAPGYLVDVPIQIASFPPGIHSAQFSLNYNQTYFTPISVTAGTILTGWSVNAFSPSPGTLNFASASSDSISASGLLATVRFQISNNAPAGSWSVNATNVLLNEGSPLPLVTNGSINLSSVALTKTVATGWNMFSLPLTIVDARKTTLFPSATTKAYAYGVSSYYADDTIHNKLGYWLKFPGIQAIPLSGAPRARDTLTMHSGWNLIGSIAYPVSTTDVVQNPPGFVTSKYYPYISGSYVASDTVKPGLGYWVKVNAPGTLVLDINNTSEPPSAATKSASDVIPSEMNELRFEPTSGSPELARLYFGQSPSQQINPDDFLLPPPPPEGALDVRFASNRSLEVIDDQHLSKGLDFTVQGEGIPIRLSLLAKAIGAKIFVLEEKQNDGRTTLHPFSANQSIRLDGNGTKSYTLKFMELPAGYALSQNYPNPFNPATEIRYQIPDAGHVVIKVFNLLGEEVATLVDEVQGAGFKSVTWNAANAASGLYFYKLTAGSFSDTKKMMLIK